MLAITAALLLNPVVLANQDEEALKVHIRLHKKVAPAIVGVRGRGRRGTGIIVDRSGLVISALTATGDRVNEVNLYLKGHKRVKAKVIGRKRSLGLVLIQMKPEDVPAALEIGDSDEVRLGHVSYVFGDSYNSIFTDDQVAMTLGHISGRYELKGTKGRVYYKGPVIETSAKINPNNDGGALVDKRGRLVGMITMNYHDAKFTGVAIPINKLKEAIAEALKELREPGWIGLKVKEEEGDVVISKLSKDSPARSAGLRTGDVVVAIDGVKVEDLAKAKALLKKVWAGVPVRITVERDGEEREFKVIPDPIEF